MLLLPEPDASEPLPPLDELVDAALESLPAGVVALVELLVELPLPPDEDACDSDFVVPDVP